jgi:hypothetical protein
VIYQKFNGDFKSHINFGGQKEDKWIIRRITKKKKKNTEFINFVVQNVYNYYTENIIMDDLILTGRKFLFPSPS